jgi:hypothetical protein
MIGSVVVHGAPRRRLSVRLRANGTPFAGPTNPIETVSVARLRVAFFVRRYRSGAKLAKAESPTDRWLEKE